MADKDHDVTALLERWRSGSTVAEAELMNRVHHELRRVAAAYLRRERRDHTLQPTAVVHEAYLRLMPQRGVRWENRAHFFGIAARMMRRILVDYARRRGAAKRDAMLLAPVVDQRRAGSAAVSPDELLSLHAALSALSALDPRQADIVEQRYFAGMTVEEIASVMQLSASTVKREWATAMLWLRRHMSATNAS